MSELLASFARNHSARHRVKTGVETMILRGEFQSGSQLKQTHLAEHFGVGQGVVREALIELQAMGLVETIDFRGIYVTRLNGKKLVDAMEVREAIEGMAARLCCGRISRSDRQKLRQMTEEIFRLLKKKKTSEQGASLDREFHHELVRHSGNEELLRVTDSYRAFGKIIHVDRDPLAIRDDHQAVLDAIEHGKADDAERLIRAHLAASTIIFKERLLADASFVPNWVV